MDSVELFSGCGGLALGLARAGLRHLLLVERDHHSVANVVHNSRRGIEHVADWKVHDGDVRSFGWSEYRGKAEVVAGGPPCQPFSIGGLHRGEEDGRDLWPEAVRAVREIKPRAFLFENVRGLARPKFAEHLEWIRLSLSIPALEQEGDQDRSAHLVQLRAHETDAEYVVTVMSVNAADFGAAQKRHRVLIMGIHRDIGPIHDVPRPTHSYARLLWDQYVSGEYWERHELRRPRALPSRSTDARMVDLLRNRGVKPKGNPWLTVRDSIAGLGEPGSRRDVPNHVFQPGAKTYSGHTGSPIDEPAKALKAGVHGVPGGENMISFSDNTVRYLTVREAARLQGLPDDYEFIGSWTENMRQLGNAVPTQLSEFFGRRLVGIVHRGSVFENKAA
ncbi:MAG: DNA (cytosine-5-)-methyltransferase [Cucumibacter sp.]